MTGWWLLSVISAMGLGICVRMPGRRMLDNSFDDGWQEGFDAGSGSAVRGRGSGGAEQCREMRDVQGEVLAEQVQRPVDAGAGESDRRPEDSVPALLHDRGGDQPDWGDELATMRVGLELEHADAVLTAPMPAAGSFEYRLAQWAIEQDSRLDQHRAEMDKQKAGWSV